MGNLCEVDGSKDLKNTKKLDEADLLFDSSKLNEALTIYKKILDLDPDNLRAQNGFTKVYTLLLEEKEDVESKEVDKETRLTILLNMLEFFDAILRLIKRKKKIKLKQEKQKK